MSIFPIADILCGIIYRIGKDTTLSTIYLEEILDGLEREELSELKAGALFQGYLKALHDLGAIDPEYWEQATDKISPLIAGK